MWSNFKIQFCTAYKVLCCTGLLTIGDTIDRAQVMNLVSNGVQEYLQSYQPPSNKFSGHQDSSQIETPPSQHANSAVSDITLQTMQRQMDMMQMMITQVCQLVNTPNLDNSSTRQRA